MKWLSSLLKFVSELLGFTKWFTNRKDNREEKANQTKAVKTHEKNSRDIDAHYP
jgi:hypothetical protein